MKRVVVAVVMALLIGPVAARAGGARDAMIVEAAWLASHVKDTNLVLLHANRSRRRRCVGEGERREIEHRAHRRAQHGVLRRFVEPALTFVGRAAMQKLVEHAGAATGDTVVSYCHIGQQATVVYFAARYLGYEAKLYDGSFQDWSRRKELPVVGKP